jgi:hypothetical protein
MQIAGNEFQVDQPLIDEMKSKSELPAACTAPDECDRTGNCLHWMMNRGGCSAAAAATRKEGSGILEKLATSGSSPLVSTAEGFKPADGDKSALAPKSTDVCAAFRGGDCSVASPCSTCLSSKARMGISKGDLTVIFGNPSQRKSVLKPYNPYDWNYRFGFLGLRLCPFCSSYVLLQERGNKERQFRIICSNDGCDVRPATMPQDSVAGAIVKWNGTVSHQHPSLNSFPDEAGNPVLLLLSWKGMEEIHSLNRAAAVVRDFSRDGNVKAFTEQVMAGLQAILATATRIPAKHS